MGLLNETTRAMVYKEAQKLYTSMQQFVGYNEPFTNLQNLPLEQLLELTRILRFLNNSLRNPKSIQQESTE